MEQALLAIILHAHLPFVRHPEYDEFLEEDWLFEAVTECYLPLLSILETCANDGIPARITIGFTPTLCEMLSDPLLQRRYVRHVERLIELADKEVHRTRGERTHDAARMYAEQFSAARDLFDRRGRNLINAFRALQDAGVIDIITSAATHALLPLITRREARRAQIEVGRRNYQKHFGRSPRGSWLPECAYEQGIDELLKEARIDYFIADAPAVMFGEPRPRSGIYAPVITPSGVAAFARDLKSSEQIWSADRGYPGDPDYREFYRDLGFDADYEYIRPFLHGDGVRRNTGIKYHRVTGTLDLGKKDLYVPAIATEKAALHAADFVTKRNEQAQQLRSLIDRTPIIVSPFDAELFGHWWYEGPQFLERLFQIAHRNQSKIKLATPLDYLSEFSANQEQELSASSWGDEGYYRVWINGKTEWLYKHQHIAEDRMIDLAREYADARGLKKRALNQAARELMLAESSDWAFIITSGTSPQYATKRFRDHIHRFSKLHEMITANQIDEYWLSDIEGRDSLFQEIEYTVYS